MGVLSEPVSSAEDKEFAEATKSAVEEEREGEQPVVEISTEPETKKEPTIEEKYNNLQVALRDEREEKRRIREDAQKSQEALRQFESLRGELDERRRAAYEQKKQSEFETNPAEYLKQQQEALAQRVDGALSEHQQQQLNTARRQQFESAVTSQVAGYKQSNPNYEKALEFGRERRFREYEALGVPEGQRAQLFDQESYQLAITAMQQGKNPAEMAYQLAETWGFKPKAEEGADDKMLRLQLGQKAAQTLSKKSSPAEDSLLKKIEDMNDKEFDDFWDEKVKPKKAR